MLFQYWVFPMVDIQPPLTPAPRVRYSSTSDVKLGRPRHNNSRENRHAAMEARQCQNHAKSQIHHF